MVIHEEVDVTVSVVSYPTLSLPPGKAKALSRTPSHSPTEGPTSGHTAHLRDQGFVQARTRNVEACVALVFGVRHESLRASTRGKADVARARQVAMYLCHTTLGFSLTTVGDLFERDRTTVGHACRLVEDMRDQADFDARLTLLERSVLAGSITAPDWTVSPAKGHAHA